jgi:hypothetical protein
MISFLVAALLASATTKFFEWHAISDSGSAVHNRQRARSSGPSASALLDGALYLDNDMNETLNTFFKWCR